MRRTNWVYFVMTVVVLGAGISTAGARAAQHHASVNGKGHGRHVATTTTTTTVPVTTTTASTTTTTVAPTTTTAATTTTIPPTTTTDPFVDVQPSFPIRAAFYYPWFPQGWDQQGISPYSNYTPALGYYDSTNPATLATHVAEMSGAGLDAGIASWWGQGSLTDQRVPLLLNAAAGTSFRWTLYYEPEGTSDPSVAQISSDLDYID